MRRKLSENTTNRIRETIKIHRINRNLLKDWKNHLMDKCKVCLAKKEDDDNNIKWKCDCDVQFFLDLIIELLRGNGGY